MKFQKREIKQRSQGGGKDMFLKIEDGDSRTGVPRGEVFEFFQKWEGGRSQVVAPDDPDAKSRFRINLIVHEDGKYVAKIWEFGLTVYNQLAAIADEYDITSTKLKVSRQGTGTNTEWLVMPCGPKDQVTPKQLKEIEAVPLLILEPRDSSKQESA